MISWSLGSMQGLSSVSLGVWTGDHLQPPLAHHGIHLSTWPPIPLIMPDAGSSVYKPSLIFLFWPGYSPTHLQSARGNIFFPTPCPFCQATTGNSIVLLLLQGLLCLFCLSVIPRDFRSHWVEVPVKLLQISTGLVSTPLLPCTKKGCVGSSPLIRTTGEGSGEWARYITLMRKLNLGSPCKGLTDHSLLDGQLPSLCWQSSDPAALLFHFHDLKAQRVFPLWLWTTSWMQERNLDARKFGTAAAILQFSGVSEDCITSLHLVWTLNFDVLDNQVI